MDPNAALEKMRDAYREILKDANDVDGSQTDEAMDLAEACEAIDLWLCKGGFLPSDWKR